MQDKPTLLHVCECYVGGVRTHLDLLLPALVERGFRVLAFLSLQRDARAETHAARLAACGVEVASWNARRGFDFDGDRVARLVIEAQVRDQAIEIVHSHGAKAGYLVRTMNQPDEVARVHTPHGFAYAKRREFGWLRRQAFRKVEQRLVKRTDQLVAVSAAEAEMAEQLGYTDGTLATIPNAVTLPDLGERKSQTLAREELQLPSTGLLALVAGILMPEKGQELILRALAERAAAGWKVCFVGEGPERARYLARARRLRLEGRAIFAGSVADMAPWIDACDLALLPSHSEGMPYVALEVLSRARPLLSSGVGGLKEIWSSADHERAARQGLALELETRDPITWSQAMQTWASAAEARQAFGTRGREIVGQRFALERHIEAHVTVYRQLASRQASSKGSAR